MIKIKAVYGSVFVALSMLFVAGQGRADAWASIAYDNNTGNWGYFFNGGTQAEADSRAIGYCQQSGGHACVVSLSYTNCGSLARASSGIWGTAHTTTAGDARSMAILSCNRFGGTDCRTLATVCGDGVIPPVGPTPIYTRINQSVIDYAAARIGQKIGDGQCWALVNEALGSAGAHQPGKDGYGTYVFGSLAYGSYHAGDILQFEGVEFHYANGGYDSFPHHTAIIESVNGTVLNLLQQNSNGNMTVQRGSIDLRGWTTGVITLYQPMQR